MQEEPLHVGAPVLGAGEPVTEAERRTPLGLNMQSLSRDALTDMMRRNGVFVNEYMQEPSPIGAFALARDFPRFVSEYMHVPPPPPGSPADMRPMGEFELSVLQQDRLMWLPSLQQSLRPLQGITRVPSIAAERPLAQYTSVFDPVYSPAADDRYSYSAWYSDYHTTSKPNARAAHVEEDPVVKLGRQIAETRRKWEAEDVSPKGVR